MMLAYSALLMVGLVVSSPWWLTRMFTTERYREGLRERLGGVPARLREAVRGFADERRVVWVHAVSVGEVLAASRLVGELETELSSEGEAWRVVVSTTTRTGQALARERFGAERVFYFPLDFAWSVRAYLRVLRPAALVLMESELWPRVLWECVRAAVPVAVVNARVSDRSFARAMRVRGVWGRVLQKVSLWLAQSEEDARRLVAMGARAECVQAIGNLKYDVRAPKDNAISQRLRGLRGPSRMIVAGSTLASEEEMLLAAWPGVLRSGPDLILILAPRHPERFGEVAALVRRAGYEPILCSELSDARTNLPGGSILILDTLGDLASVYSVASAAFIGGSLVPRGGHNPLEAARFGVPLVMGGSYENFREVVEGLRADGGVRIIDEQQLAEALIDAAGHDQSSGVRAKEFYESRAGATQRAVEAVVRLVRP
jgi:3-deoxy-D-manno-octulosonic-acid transferase